MRQPMISRRQFLQHAGLALTGAALPAGLLPETGLPSPAGRARLREKPFAIGRVTVGQIHVYQAPDYSSQRVDKRTRDQLLNLLERVESSKGPAHNPRWYRIEDGYVHSGYVQRIDFRPANTPVSSIPGYGLLAEVTVPYTRTFYKGPGGAWQPLYRLYYETLHWVHAVVQNPDGSIWYRISDAKNDSKYFVPAAHVRLLDPSEFSPIRREVPSDQKRIVVSLDHQTLTAYEGEQVMLHTSIASGQPTEVKEGEIPTDTPKGAFRITLKMPSRHMGDGRITSEIEAYELPGVPWTMAFHETGVALHGTFWHDNFGRKMSHGCVNMRNAEALWLFRWADPVYEPLDWYKKGLGTLVQVV